MEERTQHRTSTPVRLRFVLDKRSVDLALPGEVALVELLPTVLPRLSVDAADHGTDHDGWVVQRLGEPPLDPERTVAELDLFDGDTIHLRPRASQLPIDFDDLIDGVAEQVRTHKHGWSDARSRSMLLTLAALTLLTGLPVLALRLDVATQAVTSIVLTVVLLVAAGAASRAVADPVIGTVLAGVATVYAGAAGWWGADVLAEGGGPAIRFALTAFGAAAALCVGLAAVADAALLFVGALTFVLAVAVTALLSAAGPVSAPSAAATGLLVTLGAMIMLPALAFRLGGLALPLLPGKPEELGTDIAPTPYGLVVERSVAVIAYQASLSVGLGVAQVLIAWALVSTGAGWPMVFAAVASALLFMRARHVDGAVPRWATIVPAAALAAFDVYRFAARHDADTRLLVIVPLLAAGGIALVTASTTLPGRRLRPYWGRAMEIGELLAAIALLPLLGAIFDVYQTIRAWVS
jgi:type VII secretion integral membrane protein EccD